MSPLAWWFGALIVAPCLVAAGLVATLYLLGRRILRREGYHWTGSPPQYDGKVPYRDWAATMERGRRIQERE